MKILPAPYRGLHPAFPEPPPPLPDNGAIVGPCIGGFVGLPFLALAPFLKSRTKLGFTVAAWSGLLGTTWSVITEIPRRKAAKIFLENNGILVPKSEFFRRTTSFTFDDFLIGGAAAGVILASVKRPTHVTKKIPRFGGAACFGSLGGMLLGAAYVDTLELNDALKEFARRKANAERYTDEVKQGVKAALSTARVEHPESSPLASNSAQSLEKTLAGQNAGDNVDEDLFRRLQEQIALLTGPTATYRQTDTDDRQSTGGTPGSTSSTDSGNGSWSMGEDLDVLDPQPHRSHISGDGERTFIPARNYNWRPKATDPAELERHLEHVSNRRRSSSREAELLWHQIAIREAELFKTPMDDPKRPELDAKLDQLNEVHTMLWGDIVSYQWMVSNCEKIRLQLEAEKNGSQWIPPPPENSDNIVPELTLKALKSLEESAEEAVEQLKMLTVLIQQAVDNAPHVEPGSKPYIDPATGNPTDDPVGLNAESVEIAEKQVDRIFLRDRTIRELVAEWRRNGGE